MAIFTPGPMAGAISGSIGGTTFSHNKGGPYIRRRGIPTTTPTQAQLDTRSRLIQVSRSFQSLNAENKLAWFTYAVNTPITNRLGNQIMMSAHQAYVAINSLRLKCGDPVLTVPVQGPAPDPLATMTMTTDLGAGDFNIAYTVTPLAASIKLYVTGWLEDSAGVKYVKNKYAWFLLSPAAQASPLDLQAAFIAKFGSVGIGQTIWIQARTYSQLTGLLSAPQQAAGVCVST